MYAANAFLEGVKVLVRIAKHSLDIVIAFLEAVKVLFKAGLQAISAIVRFTLGGIFDIRKISFDVGLGVATGGHFRVSLAMTLFGNWKELSLDLDFSNFGAFIRSIGESIIRGLTKFIS